MEGLQNVQLCVEIFDRVGVGGVECEALGHGLRAVILTLYQSLSCHIIHTL